MVLSGLKKYFHDITALVAMADDGGSTGELRDEMGVLPPGDVRQCLVALAHSPKVRDLFNFRFDSGSFKGHSFGNLFLTALEKMTGDFREGVKLATEVLQVVGQVEPMTLDKSTPVIRNGKKIVRGQRNIEDTAFVKSRPQIWLEPNPTANPNALEAIAQADLIVIAPGSLYTSLGVDLIIPGVGEALARAKAKKVYICNLVTKPGETDGFTVEDFADELERMAGTHFLDCVVYNQNQPARELLKRYAEDGEKPVKASAAKTKKPHYKVRGGDLLSSTIWKNPSKNDDLATKRTLIRHDPDCVAQQIRKLVK